MTRIYLIRAAQSEGHLYRIAQGHSEGNLTDLGWRQAQELGQRFADTDIHVVYTSNLYRARATASAIYQPKGIPECPWDDLREICLGSWDGLPWGNIAYKEAEQIGFFQNQPDKWGIPDGEQHAHVLNRMNNALRQIAKDNEGKSIAIVTHGYAMRLLLAGLQGIPWQQAQQLPLPAPTAVAVIEAEGDTWRLVSPPDARHLSQPPAEASPPGSHTDLYIHPLPWIEYGEIFAGAVEFVWEEAAEDRAYDKNALLGGLGIRTTYAGFMEYNPVAFLQLGPDPGWITLILTHPGCRNIGLGAQLLGQAVCAARASGLDYLRIALPKGNPHRGFFEKYGFSPVGKTPEGREVLQKDIGFLPEFLSNPLLGDEPIL